MRSTPLLLMVALLLGAGCSNAPAPAPAESGSAVPAEAHLGVWYWIGTTTAAQAVVVADPTRYEINLSDAETMLVRADCNRGRGGYTLAAGALAIGPIGLTKMGCPEGSQDGEFLAQLGRGGLMTLDSGWLHIEFGEGKGTMHFARDPKSVLKR
jgi:heat shock protein HslJ